jgi:hypothetical protein
MNKFATAGNFGVGLTNSTIWASRSWLNEFKTVSDGTSGAAWAAKLLDVTKIAVSATAPRASADITVDFVLPKASGTADSDYVAF